MWSEREACWTQPACLPGAELTLTALDGVGTGTRGGHSGGGWSRTHGWRRYTERGQRQRQMNVSRGAGRQGVRWARFSPGKESCVRCQKEERGGFSKQGMNLTSSPLGSCLFHELPWVWNLVPGSTAGAGKGARFPAGTSRGEARSLVSNGHLLLA